MTDRNEVRRRVSAYADSIKQAPNDLSNTKEGIERDPRLRNIRVDADDSGGSSQSDKLDMILSHLDSVHTALADTNARVDAMQGGRADGDDDDQEDETRAIYAHPGKAEEGRNMPGEPTPLVADRDEKDARRGRRDAAYTKDEPINQPIENSDKLRTAAADFQGRADAVFQMQGGASSAPRYLAGETLLGYKRRILRGLKNYSPSWKDSNVMAINDSQTLEVVADQIFKEAKAHLSSPASVPAGYVREIRERDQSGREIIRFVGNAEDVWGPWKATTRRLVHVNKNPNA